MSDKTYQHPVLQQYGYSIIQLASNHYLDFPDLEPKNRPPSWETSRLTNVGVMVGANTDWQLKLSNKEISHPDWDAIKVALQHLSYCLEHKIDNPTKEWLEDLKRTTKGALRFTGIKPVCGLNLKETADATWTRFVKS